MPRRSKREVAPPPPPVQAAAGAAPWGPMPPPPGVFPSSVRPSGGVMDPLFASAAWWPRLPGLLPLPQPPPPSSSALGRSEVSLGAQPSAKDGMESETSDCPSGGLLSYLQHGLTSFPAPWPPAPSASSSSQHDAPSAPSGTEHAAPVIDYVQDARKAKRLPYTEDEDKRLVSAWLHNSNDPINGNCKKNEKYWTDVLADYNNATPAHRKREMKQLKERFQKIKRWVGMFCGSWKKACSIYSSGQSDDMLRDKALSFYLADFQEGPFTVMHGWRMLRNEPKWHVILDDMDNSNKKRLDSEGELKDGESEDPREQRPMGTKRAKKLRNEKGKGDAKSDETEINDDMKKFMEIQEAANKRHEKMIETQQRLSDARIEAAKLRKEAAMAEAYKTLVGTDTRDMTDEMKAEHVIAMRTLREKLYGNTN
ncbi:hypothetical protein EJB05_51228 [Eragrostis curvula]|uniref:No apical meristem-associated C-terminal domain-containing protein n=1 Tax=Eragrostis curvula TaxID=38414 RepID=A0A5J9SW70_9POAL|nr:hypothetical protein EJB05_51228 [Eragrostis curvula]